MGFGFRVSNLGGFIAALSRAFLVKVFLLLSLWVSVTEAQVEVKWREQQPSLWIEGQKVRPIWYEAYHDILKHAEGWRLSSHSIPGATPDKDPVSGKHFLQRSEAFGDAYISPESELCFVGHHRCDEKMYHLILTNNNRFVSIYKDIPTDFLNENHKNLQLRIRVKLNIPEKFEPYIVSKSGISASVKRAGWKSCRFEKEDGSIYDLTQDRFEFSYLVCNLSDIPVSKDSLQLHLSLHNVVGEALIERLEIIDRDQDNNIIYFDSFTKRHGWDQLLSMQNTLVPDGQKLLVNIKTYLRDLVPLINDPRGEQIQDLPLKSILHDLPSSYLAMFKLSTQPANWFLFPELETIAPDANPNVVTWNSCLNGWSLICDKLWDRLVIFANRDNPSGKKISYDAGHSLLRREPSLASPIHIEHIKEWTQKLSHSLSNSKFNTRVGGFLFGFYKTTENLYPWSPPEKENLISDYSQWFSNYPDPKDIFPGNNVFHLDRGWDVFNNSVQKADFSSKAISEISTSLKSNWKARSIVTATYYSYIMEGALHIKGHNGPLPAVDMIMAPSSYELRGLRVSRTGNGFDPFGATGGFMTLKQGLHNNNIMMVQELDIRTLNTYEDFVGGGEVCTLCPSTELAARGTIQREMSIVQTHGTGAYFLDFGHHKRFWYQGYEKQIQDLSLSYPLDLDNRDTASEVAVVFDRRSSLYGNASYMTFYRQLTNEFRSQLVRSGIQHDWIYLEDLKKINSDKYKMYIFLNTVELSVAMQTEINRLKNNNRLLAFVYASGYASSSFRFSTARMSSLIGMNIKVVDKERALRIASSSSLSFPEFGVPSNTTVKPFFHVDDKSVQKLGKITGFLSSYVGIAQRNFPNWKSVYIGAPGMPEELLRYLAKEANVHLYQESSDVVFIGNNRLYVHSRPGSSDTVKVKLLGEVQLTPLVGGDTVLKRDFDGKFTNFEFASPKNRVNTLYSVSITKTN